MHILLLAFRRREHVPASRTLCEAVFG